MVKIVAVCILFAIIIVFLRNINSDLTILVAIMSGIIMLYMSIDYLQYTFEFFSSVINLISVDAELIKVVFKVTTIGYLVEFGAGIIEDFGLKSLSDKLVFVGKLAMLCVSLPVIYAFFNLIMELLWKNIKS